MSSTRHSVLCIGATDNSGGSGLFADQKTLSALKVHQYSVTTAVTFQNCRGFFGSYPLPLREISQQFDAIFDECIPNVIKIGFLPDRETLEWVFSRIAGLDCLVIFDPVLKSTSGFSFPITGRDIREVLSYVDLLTPNKYEAEKILGPEASRLKVMETLIHNTGVSFLIKGGHSTDEKLSSDLWVSRERSFTMNTPRIGGGELNRRGTGCTLATAIAAFYSLNPNLPESIVQGKSYMTQCLKTETKNGEYLAYTDWPELENTLPWIGRKGLPFPDCGPEPLGFYPVVDSFEWVQRLLILGVKTIQLRIKEDGECLEDEIESSIQLSIELARQHDCRLFINDHWELALKFKAYGVHLGQEDLATADIDRIFRGGLRLGISSHSYEEAAIAHSYSPSYVALGPIYPTTLKKMRFAPQGLERLRIWNIVMPYPIVAIGGMTVERAKIARENGANSVAVVSDVTKSRNDEKRIKEWQGVFTQTKTGFNELESFTGCRSLVSRAFIRNRLNFIYSFFGKLKAGNIGEVD